MPITKPLQPATPTKMGFDALTLAFSCFFSICHYTHRPVGSINRWRIYGESCDDLRPVADRILSREEVLEFERQLSLLSEPAVRNQYVEAHSKCCLARGRLPTPEEIQHL